MAIVAMPPKLATIPSHAVLIDLTAGSEHLLSPDASPAHGTSEASEDAGNQNIPSWSRQQSPCSVLSVASSGRLFAEPQQTLLFLDWDDTMFPCTELFYKRGLPKRSKDWTPPDPELLAALEPWQRAVKEFLGRACAVSDRCVILTNSRKPWVWSSGTSVKGGGGGGLQGTQYVCGAIPAPRFSLVRVRAVTIGPIGEAVA